MDQNYNNNQNDFLWTLLANPADDAYRYNYNLQRLVNDFPQSGILQALLAHSSEQKNLKQASVYFNARSLYKLINAPTTLIGVSNDKIIINGRNLYADFNGYHHPEAPAAPENYFSDNVPDNDTPSSVFAPEVTNEPEPPVPETPVTDWTDQQIEDLPAEEHTVPSYNDIDNVLPEIPAETEAKREEPADEKSDRETIINYAFNLGQKLPPESEPPVVPNEEAAQQPVSEISPLPDLPPVIEQPEDTHDLYGHMPPPVPSEETVAAHPADATVPPPVPAEHASTATIPDASESIEQSHADNTQPEGPQAVVVTETDTTPAEEPIQQYRPWDETSETSVPQTDVFETSTSAHEPDTKVNLTSEDSKETDSERINSSEQTASPAAEIFRPVEKSDTEEHWNQSETESGNIEEETFDEITGIENIAIEKDVISNIAANDYFSFDQTFGEHKAPQAENNEAVNEEEKDEKDSDRQDVSKYHDEKLPYSFLWWLDKTRKEYSRIYQPYKVAGRDHIIDNLTKAKLGTDELQQQYYENIFHITSVDDLDRSLPQPPYAKAAAPVDKKKEQMIIDRFIREEPQIKPQSGDKIDNENKAKKSSEDRDELVSETLAAIYSDQMLYHKAISSYKKLMLRFPEKSRYFAAKIEQLEKKTN
ncbi:MAG TPA: hypothetical protein VHA56_01390 [Mucilaginibacter sp.]|nr:hypothetical protein [Mucilaginibacter sp.]